MLQPFAETTANGASIEPGCFSVPDEPLAGEGLIAHAYTDEHGALAQLNMILISEGAKSRTVLSRLSDYAHQTATLASHSVNLALQSDQALQRQRDEADMAATAMNERAAWSKEIGVWVCREMAIRVSASGPASMAKACCN